MSLLIKLSALSKLSIYWPTVPACTKAWNFLTLSQMELSTNLSPRYLQNLCQGRVWTLNHVPLHQCTAVPLRYETTNSVLCSKGVLAVSKYCSIVCIQCSVSSPANSGILSVAGFTLTMPLLASCGLLLLCLCCLFPFSSGSSSGI